MVGRAKITGCEGIRVDEYDVSLLDRLMSHGLGSYRFVIKADCCRPYVACMLVSAVWARHMEFEAHAGNEDADCRRIRIWLYGINRQKEMLYDDD